jgi:hemin uptake protein HemP
MRIILVYDANGYQFIGGVMATSVSRRTAPPDLNKVQVKSANNQAASNALDTEILFAASSEVVITHGAEIYRLRLTRQNRLILTK